MTEYLVHHGVRGQRWGIRRYQHEDGTRTLLGKKHEAQLEGYEYNGKSSDKQKIERKGLTEEQKNRLKVAGKVATGAAIVAIGAVAVGKVAPYTKIGAITVKNTFELAKAQKEFKRSGSTDLKELERKLSDVATKHRFELDQVDRRSLGEKVYDYVNNGQMKDDFVSVKNKLNDASTSVQLQTGAALAGIKNKMNERESKPKQYSEKMTAAKLQIGSAAAGIKAKANEIASLGTAKGFNKKVNKILRDASNSSNLSTNSKGPQGKSGKKNTAYSVQRLIKEGSYIANTAGKTAKVTANLAKSVLSTNTGRRAAANMAAKAVYKYQSDKQSNNQSKKRSNKIGGNRYGRFDS